MERISIVSIWAILKRNGDLIDLDPDTEEQKTLFEMDPKLSLKYSKMIESELNQRFKLIVKGTEESKNAKKVSSWVTTKTKSCRKSTNDA